MPLIRSDLLATSGYRRPAGETAGQELARLHLNEAAWDWPAGARAALLRRLQRLPFQRYPERQGELTERLARRVGAPQGGVLLGPSSGALLDLVALAGLDPGDRVALPEPGFSLYPSLVTRHRARMLPVPVGDGFPLQPWLALLEGDCPRQLWLTLPNNPSGAWLDPEALEPLLAAAARRPDPPLVVLDEAYAEFAPGTHRLAVDRYPNVLLLRTFSKALASAGWRLGYAVGAPGLIAALAALQLPYSIPAPALEALDVALDFQGAFAEPIRELPERRQRLAAALGARATGSAGNFLQVRPDPAAALRAAGLQSRSLSGDAGRVTVGSEAETQRVAAALGSVLAPPAPRTPRRLLVLDMDGVLLDAERGFMDAVAQALKVLAPGLPWQDAHYLAFKQLPGFNNDFRLCAAALALAERDGLNDPWPTRLADLEPRIQALEPRCAEQVQRCYPALAAQDRPLVSAAELAALGWDLAIYTGRNAAELELGFQALGFRLPAVPDTAAHLRKPSPGGLLQLADRFQAERIVFAGDSRDDAQALRLAREQRPDLVWRFAAVGGQREFIASGEDLRVPSLRSLLAILEGDRA